MPSFDKAIILALAPLGASGYRPPQKDSSSAVTPDAAGKMNKLARSEVGSPSSGGTSSRLDHGHGSGSDADVGEGTDAGEVDKASILLSEPTAVLAEGLDTNGMVTHSLAELSQANLTSTEGLDTDGMITDSLAELSKGNHTSEEGCEEVPKDDCDEQEGCGLHNDENTQPVCKACGAWEYGKCRDTTGCVPNAAGGCEDVSTGCATFGDAQACAKTKAYKGDRRCVWDCRHSTCVLAGSVTAEVRCGACDEATCKQNVGCQVMSSYCFAEGQGDKSSP